HIALEQLKEPLNAPAFRPPSELAAPGLPPEEKDFLPTPPSGLGALAPGRKRAHAAAVAEGQAAYDCAIAQYAHAEQARQEQLDHARAEHDRLIAGERERIRQQHDVVDRWAREFAVGHREAIADYFHEVLAGQHRRDQVELALPGGDLNAVAIPFL